MHIRESHLCVTCLFSTNTPFSCYHRLVSRRPDQLFFEFSTFSWALSCPLERIPDLLCIRVIIRVVVNGKGRIYHIFVHSKLQERLFDNRVCGLRRLTLALHTRRVRVYSHYDYREAYCYHLSWQSRCASQLHQCTRPQTHLNSVPSQLFSHLRSINFLTKH
jgi:hypothetical protein